MLRELVGAIIGNRWGINLRIALRLSPHSIANDSHQIIKSLNDSVAPTLAGGDLLEIDLARQVVAHSARERYQGQVVRARLIKVSNETMNMCAELCKKEIRRGSDQYISQVNTPDGHTCG